MGSTLETGLLEELKKQKIIAIIRGIEQQKMMQTAQALAEGGIRFIEVTLNTKGALEAIAEMKKQYGTSLHIGAGTVLDLDMAIQAIDAGATYLISPNLDEEVVAYGHSKQVDVWPGVMTPTEMVKAWKAGAKAVKLFPIGSLGFQYIKEISAPLGHIPIIATGGIGLENVNQPLAAGAIAVGLGSQLVDKNLVKNGQFNELTQRARAFVQAVTQ